MRTLLRRIEKGICHGKRKTEIISAKYITAETDHMAYQPGMDNIGSEIQDEVISRMNAYDADAYTAADVLRALHKDVLSPEDFAALLSPAALPFLEQMAQRAQMETRKHFGNSVQMFTPLYIANYCENYCIYCGFNCHNKIRRAKLDMDEIEQELKGHRGDRPAGDSDADRREPRHVAGVLHRRGGQAGAQVFPASSASRSTR